MCRVAGFNFNENEDDLGRELKRIIIKRRPFPVTNFPEWAIVGQQVAIDRKLGGNFASANNSSMLTIALLDHEGKVADAALVYINAPAFAYLPLFTVGELYRTKGQGQTFLQATPGVLRHYRVETSSCTHAPTLSAGGGVLAWSGAQMTRKTATWRRYTAPEACASAGQRSERSLEYSH